MWTNHSSAWLLLLYMSSWLISAETMWFYFFVCIPLKLLDGWCCYQTGPLTSQSGFDLEFHSVCLATLPNSNAMLHDDVCMNEGDEGSLEALERRETENISTVLNTLRRDEPSEIVNVIET